MEHRVKNKTTPKALKYKLYKQLRLEIWGSLILKKKRNKFTLRLLRTFELMLSKRILRNISNRPIPNKCFSGYFGSSFFKKRSYSGLNF
mgnify:CR=1 FL=1